MKFSASKREKPMKGTIFMKVITFIALFGALVLTFDCSNKKNNAQKDNLTQLLLAGGGAGSGSSSCLTTTKCAETYGYPPLGFDFSGWCASQRGTIVQQTCAAQGFTQCEGQPQGLGGFFICTKPKN